MSLSQWIGRAAADETRRRDQRQGPGYGPPGGPGEIEGAVGQGSRQASIALLRRGRRAVASNDPQMAPALGSFETAPGWPRIAGPSDATPRGPALAGHPLHERPIEALPAPYSDNGYHRRRSPPGFGLRGPCAAGSGCFHGPRWPRFGRSWPNRLGPAPDLAGRAGDRRDPWAGSGKPCLRAPRSTAGILTVCYICPGHA